MEGTGDYRKDQSPWRPTEGIADNHRIYYRQLQNGPLKTTAEGTLETHRRDHRDPQQVLWITREGTTDNH